jgi:hypothetical protein
VGDPPDTINSYSLSFLSFFLFFNKNKEGK